MAKSAFADTATDAEERFAKREGAARPDGDAPMTAAPSPRDASVPDPRNVDALLDNAAEQTFPASDPPAVSRPAGPTGTPPTGVKVRRPGSDYGKQASVDTPAAGQADHGLSDERQPSR